MAPTLGVSLLLGNDGNLYGNFLGGVFQLAPSASGWTENVIYQGA